MAAAARSLARPGAADAVAELVLATARRKPLPDAARIEAISRGAGGGAASEAARGAAGGAAR